MLQVAVDSPELQRFSAQLTSEGVEFLLARNKSALSYLTLYDLFVKRFLEPAQEAKVPGVRSVSGTLCAGSVDHPVVCLHCGHTRNGLNFVNSNTVPRVPRGPRPWRGVSCHALENPLFH
jgi:hypothetical protein